MRSIESIWFPWVGMITYALLPQDLVIRKATKSTKKHTFFSVLEFPRTWK